jgi:hypothetical protein
LIADNLFTLKSGLTDIIKSNYDPSYFSLLGALELDRKNFKKQWNAYLFETDFNYSIIFNNLPKSYWNCFFAGYFDITMKIPLRMYMEYSMPVKTPSFMPRLTYYFWFKRLNDPSDNLLYFSIMLSHHSNAQKGNFYNDDGTLNVETGNFSTNYLEFASYYLKHFKWFVK